ncbi:MAG: GNAT family N-acetyltransferase [Clostridia bacterium]|nr:GNAT family N-acetyltransferase [Clostridia bacterium]
MSLMIRLACPDDAEALRRLNEAFNEISDVSAEDICRSLIASGKIVAVVDVDKCIVGFCCAQVHHSFCYPAPVAEITELYVDAAHRRMGCASGMLRYLETTLREDYGADECHLLTSCANHTAQSLYASLGYEVHHETYMSKSL